MNNPLRIPKPYVPGDVKVVVIRFLGEQVGPSETLLKTKLTDFFIRDQSVERAYLCRIQNGETLSVALCLKSKFGKDPGLAEKIGRIFATLFGRSQFLDILFLSDEREVELRTACPAFFVKPESTDNTTMK